MAVMPSATLEVDAAVVRSLLRAQRPDLADLSLVRNAHG